MMASHFAERHPNAALVLADGTAFPGHGLGAIGTATGELVFNTAMTGYQEILSDPSYARQIVTFTSPHIGNVGCNRSDNESAAPAAIGAVMRCPITQPSNWRAEISLENYLLRNEQVGICGVDTRAITKILRDKGAQRACLAFLPGEKLDLDALAASARDWSGMDGLDLVPDVTTKGPRGFRDPEWDLADRDGIARFDPSRDSDAEAFFALRYQDEPDQMTDGDANRPLVVVMDYGVKRNILRALVSRGCRVRFLPADTSGQAVLTLKPAGVLLANGPGDPAATGRYAVAEIRHLMDSGVPIFGICLGHQMLGLAAGGKTVKMPFGHHGANHPVQDVDSRQVLITSQNHGFALSEGDLPHDVRITHRSLFDGTIQGIAISRRPIFSVQFHPEASPGPHDASYLFDHFIHLIKSSRI